MAPAAPITLAPPRRHQSILKWNRIPSRLTAVISISDWRLVTILKAQLIFGNNAAWSLHVNGGSVWEEIDQTNHFYCQMPR